uniref:J domain-containing protein n=1 Tax=Leersia perrieri TaxID=77586 RepID=A0A0D9WG83_9ORYZ
MASTSSFPTCSGGVAFGRTRRAPSPSPRCAASRRLRPVSAQGGGGGGGGDARGMLDPLATPFQILGLDTSASYSAAQLKAAFRSRVKEFHPDVCKDTENADLIMKRVLEAYEEQCCPYSCVKRAPHAFAFADDTGTARAISQGLGNDYNVQLAVGQCPRKCICYVTPCQRIILEEVLASVLMTPYDLSEAAVLDSLLSKATFENNRYKKPKRETKSSSDYVDWM